MKKANLTIILIFLGLVVFDVLSVGFCVWSVLTDWAEPQFTLMIVFINFAYHFTYRVIVGFAVRIFNSKINVESNVFRPKSWEKKFLEMTGIKKWKDILPAWNRKSFVLSLADVKNADRLKEVLRENISAEIIHHINFFLSFGTCLLALVPVLYSNWYVFFITSLVAALFADFPFILIQRYNRFRLYSLYDRAISRVDDKKDE